MFVDFVINGTGAGPVGSVLQGCRYDPGMLRPYFDRRGERCVTINSGRYKYDSKLKREVPEQIKVRIADLQARGINSPVFNATSLRKEQWEELDKRVERAARKRLRAWTDLSNSASYGGFDAMSKMTLEYETMSDPGEAIVDMDGLSADRTDNPIFKIRSLPLPITHSGFTYSSRRLAVGRNGNMPLDYASAEASGRRCGEMIEQTLIGTQTGVTYGTQTAGVGAHDGTSTVYGYTNFPQRVTLTTLALPTNVSWSAGQTLANILAMRSTMYNNKFYGPFMVYHSTDWDLYLDNDYLLTGGNVATETLRDRIRKIEDIQDVRRLDFLPGPFTLIMVQMSSEVAEAVNGMEITTVQWETKGGMEQNFKVMAIKVPRLKTDTNSIAGIIHGTTS